MTHSGSFLLYFNRHADAPRVWCISAPDRSWEVGVQSIICFVTLTSRYAPDRHDSTRSNDVAPAAWFEGSGEVVVDENGKAYITQTPNK